MRPKKLTLQAFGSFARRVTLDFERFDDASLLLIHGQTGGGKTTLLDGLCFALYGETSGGGRSARELRSHHAAETVETQAVLELSVRGREYIVKRSFRLVGQKGTVKAKQELLTRRPGEERFVTVATKVSDIERHVRELIGLDAAQFRQVVVLPQGRFRELLEASSRDREAILETLFDTARFREVEDALKASAGEVREEAQRLERDRELLFDHAGVESAEELRGAATKAREELARLTRRIEEDRKLLDQREKALVELRERKARFEELARVERELSRLEREAPEHARRVAALADARRAAAVTEVGRRRKDAQAALDGLVRRHVKATDAAVSAATALTKARETLAREEARTEERRALEEERARLVSLLERAEALESARAELRAAETARGALAREASAHAARREEVEGALARAREALAEATSRAQGAEEAARRIEDGERKLARLKARAKARAELARVQGGLSSCTRAEQAAKDALSGAERAAEDVERRWLDGVAAHLAAGLGDGDPCPVCGSVEHPARAEATAAEPASSPAAHGGGGPRGAAPREQVEEARAAVQRARAELEQAREATRALEHERARVEERLAALSEGRAELSAGASGGSGLAADSADDEERRALEGSLAEARERLRAARAAAGSVEALRGAVAREEAALADVEAALAAVRSREAEADGKVAAARAVVAERARGLDEGDVSPRALEGRIADVEARVVALAEARAKAEEDERRAAEELGAARALVRGLDEERVARERELSLCQEELREALLASGFEDEETAASAALTEEEREAMEAAVREHEGRSLAARERHQELSDELAGVQLEDPAPLEAEVVHRRAVLEELREQCGVVKQQEALYAGFCEELRELEETLAAARRRYGVVGRLAEAALGEHSGRVTFQRWVLGALLDGVLERASQRLLVMTRGRYTLHRMLGPVARKRSQGLDLAVLDAYTGRERPVSSLSGGESFLTALALALGLADAVQARMGGVQLECLFVDEGFGGLDPESMDLALDALLQLKGSGRLVGIISHVAELQERIEARLEVIPTRAGSELLVA